MRDKPNTLAPAVPAFVEVHTHVPGTNTCAKCWVPLAVVDFYRQPEADMQLRRIRLETVG
jgi:hypothetical protein